MNLLGFFVGGGVVVGILLAIVIIAICNNNGKVKTDYDERQEAIRGRGYKYGMYTAWILMGLYCVCEISEINLHMEAATIAFAILAISAIVQCSHAVFNDAYFGKNSNAKKFLICFGVIGIIDLICSIQYFVDGQLIVDGMMTWRGITPIVTAMVIIIYVEILIKNIMDKKAEAEE